MFVREFAKLRWGVFDETPLKSSGKDSEYYVDPDMPPSKSLTPIKCSVGVKGKSKYLTDYSGFKAGDECTSTQHKYHGKCRFYPDEDQGDTVWLASLMFRTRFQKISISSGNQKRMFFNTTVLQVWFWVLFWMHNPPPDQTSHSFFANTVVMTNLSESKKWAIFLSKLKE